MGITFLFACLASFLLHNFHLVRENDNLPKGNKFQDLPFSPLSLFAFSPYFFNGLGPRASALALISATAALRAAASPGTTTERPTRAGSKPISSR
jgi:hypothetical protein